MKTFTLIILAFISISSLSCSKYLDLSPLDQVVDADYWNSADDIKYYANQFYTVFPSHAGYSLGIYALDNNSDNMVPGTYNQRLAGQNTENSSNGFSWSFSGIRSVNHGLAHSVGVPGNPDQVSKYRGELYFFRAFMYFTLVRGYGDVPWISKTLLTDSEELYMDRTTRTVVVDSILNDLDSAIAYLPLKANAETDRLNKESALLFKSRVALYEGTWQKYHAGTVFGTAGADYRHYLQAAAATAKELIDLPSASLFISADVNYLYRSMFGRLDLSDNPEVLLYKKYDESMGISHHMTNYIRSGANTGLSVSLIDDYLCIDGKPIAISDLYEGNETLSDIVANRDPRLTQTIWTPGDTVVLNSGIATIYKFPRLDVSGELRSVSGFDFKKGVAEDPSSVNRENPAILFRYAEALLNYVEAKAELGEITQSDVDISINELRRRINMPHLVIGDIVEDPNWLYPDKSPIINEIRRERRVELASEGFRFDDLARWAEMDILIGARPRGIKFHQENYPSLEVGVGVYVDENGYVDPYQNGLANGYQFNLDRDYLTPIPPNQLTLNRNYTQNPGWRQN
ncbi:RagB/SusD family nutrient uptake outer membrane protein [Parapedobacter deserti]|uniref:RagB/SusD family nutrient uptake outer membrane protein n=1 Tax=Parapedobacter deserti TaxID=1912957 RepID=A0ABV7JNH6_9SPHI